MKKTLKMVGLILVLLIAAYFMPFIVTEGVSDKGEVIKVPFGASEVVDTGNEITFKSMRSAYAMSKDMENALMSYEVNECYGKVVYYDEDNDKSYFGFEVASNGIGSKGTYAYEKGNACKGWSADLAIKYTMPLLEEVKYDFNKALKDDEVAVLYEDGTLKKDQLVYGFINNVRLGQLSMCRIVTEEGIIDLQVLEDGTYEVRTKINGEITTKNYKHMNQFDDDTEIVAYNTKGYDEKTADVVVSWKED